MENKNENPLVSVIIPTYNGSENIVRALTSIENQTYKNIEVFVVDDNGLKTENQIKTEEKVYSKKWNFKFNYLKHEINKNGAAARNTGLEKVSGKYTCFLDDDDLFLTEKIERSVLEMEKNPSKDMFFCGVILRRNGTFVQVTIPEEEKDMQKALMFNGSKFGTGSNIFAKTEKIKEVKGFDEKYRRHQDLEFLLRMFEICSSIVVPDILIIKDNSSFVTNIPKYQKMRDIKNMLHKDFKFITDRWTKEEQDKYFMLENTELLKNCFMGETKENIKKAADDVKKYRSLSASEKVFKTLALTKIGEHNCYYNLKKIYLKNDNRAKKLDQTLVEKCAGYIEKCER